MEKFVDEKWFRTDVFEIVDQFPDGYVVWNIGRHNFNHPCFIPLAKPDYEFGVLTTDLKALKVDSEDLALYVMDRAIKGSRLPEDRKWFDRVVKKYKNR